ncbi:hypothetical protein ACFVWG_34185 [Kribbella sp. NPDC058245]|uniref:hypothetical protein n=1 Tax=Kribbella sp. NPDC058245 TaxID=3346399 RepID=UPI0036E700E9
MARSIQEAGLYVELHPCECGAGGELTMSLAEQDGQQVAIYEGDCPECGRARRFEFALPAEPTTGPAYGGSEPSTIIDAGEFLWYSDRVTEAAAEGAGAQARSAVDTAIAALDEVLKFIPDGADAVPREALTSELGKAVYDAGPDRFARAELAYRRGLLAEARELT